MHVPQAPEMITQQAGKVRPGRIPALRQDGDAGRLVDRQQGLILPQDDFMQIHRLTWVAPTLNLRRPYSSNPFGFSDCQRQASAHMASRSRCAFQPNSRPALAGSA
jgi:hypothetical protein